MDLQGTAVVTLSVRDFHNFRDTAMIIKDLVCRIVDIVLPFLEDDDRVELMDVLVISLREHASNFLEQIRDNAPITG